MDELFDITGKVSVITGGAGILCSEMAKALGKRGSKIAILDLNEEQAKAVAKEIGSQGGTAIAVKTDVLDKSSLEKARDVVLETYGKVDILINGAGGNKKEATTTDTFEFFDIPPEAIQWVFNLNLLGTVLTTQAFGKVMAKQGEGIVINISSMASLRPLTRVIGYSTAKAAINNFTAWMAVHFNLNYSKNIRVNALAPGFFLTNQNRFLLTDEATGEPTERGRQIIAHTPMGRYGVPEDLIGTLIWLVSDASQFVNGIVVPIDGGFAAYSGV